MEAKENVLLDIKDLHIWYRVYGGYLKVLNGVNLILREGERVGLVGEAGCGKTTTMKSILQILPPGDFLIPKGEIYYKGKDILKMNSSEIQRLRSREIAMIFQDPTAALNPVFTVGTQIGDVIKYSIALEEKKVHKEKIKILSVKALKEVSLPDPERMLVNYPFQLSGGMRQRVCIAMAISSNRNLLIADEPGTSLDVTIQDQILRLLKEIVEKKGTSIILITHSLGVAREMTDRIYVMYAGTIVETALTKDLFRNPVHPYTKGLLASVPKLSGGGIAKGIPGRIPDYLNPPQGCRFQPRCQHATCSCAENPPQLFEVEKGHLVACYLAQR
ncbi:ABC transporter ATP-binding protein [Candidatus Cryosericum septentrionale]|jgi:peptide/nickel transport system ATP-binding protein|uniref:ABC transporter ATP-binding protein n=1 Tax=Candidatus Cryosericum septentrionale TaxID=2290913 RepID=A0A398DXK3_9BACT|nr:ABC transporter ATP-binding protein [Candidatus Cryosericum septentrionale]RIE16878.1 ABC transporter ATP-binding protein [Candidatus Cryosericum septentrionale]